MKRTFYTSFIKESNSATDIFIPIYIGDILSLSMNESAMKEKLSFHELAQYKKYINIIKARNYLLSHFHLRQELDLRLKTNPGDLSISFPVEGKPFVEGTNMDFSISHSGNFYAIAIADSPDLKVGVDLEKIVVDFNYEQIMENYFHDEEKEYILNPKTDRRTMLLKFLEIWTRKEAFLKMTGIGLINQLSQLKMTSDNNIIHVNLPPEILFKGNQAYLYTYKTNEFVVSLSCSEYRNPVIK